MLIQQETPFGIDTHIIYKGVQTFFLTELS